jgi:hypothetical protein
MTKLNLTRFVEEVAGSVAEARLKLTDLPAALQVCSHMLALALTLTGSARTC